ncbi:uncharacterized protein ColSpa_02797 [Colletotrichum spaethianum]|uniref:Arb2 domain-containing protein n=1 Tax=Colletotrichum spaethianum TaxID=700344 RepID=A0AA37L6D6_9PEZI|nr:uncharacterized protein ColSpa_02797 [Colletotrichum spaethianum]GKT42616.1 hypothetical protein ColSpa_02797 [Colletotrichum spaethianum]
MFRRRWSGLPKDPVFSSNLKDLGYFVNDQDEIRNIGNPNYYFKYYLTKNGRVNDRQRFHFSGKNQLLPLFLLLATDFQQKRSAISSTHVLRKKA